MIMPQGYRFGNHGNPFLALLQTQGSVCQLLFSGRLQSLTVNELFFHYYEQDILFYRSLIKDGRQYIQFRVTKLCALCLPNGSQQITTTFSGTKLSIRHAAKKGLQIPDDGPPEHGLQRRLEQTVYFTVPGTKPLLAPCNAPVVLQKNYSLAGVVSLR